MKTFSLGTPVAFSATLFKVDGVWVPEEHPVKTGIIVGKRTIKDFRYAYCCDWSGGTYRESTLYNPRTAYLVAFDLLRKPVYVYPQHLILK